jgi:hypothetical protein
MRTLACLALACAACQPALFSQCKYEVAPAPAADVYHVDRNDLTTCGEPAYPLIGLTATSDNFGLVISSPGVAVHIQGENGFSADYDSFKGVDPTGTTLETTGLIQLSVSVPHAVIEFPDGRSWLYVLTDGPAPVAFTSP